MRTFDDDDIFYFQLPDVGFRVKTSVVGTARVGYIRRKKSMELYQEAGGRGGSF